MKQKLTTLFLLPLFVLLFLFVSVPNIHAQNLGSWENVDDMRASRFLPQATLLQNGKVLIVGNSSSQGESVAELFNSKTEKWEQTSPVSMAIQGSTVTDLKNGKLLIAGFGYGKNNSELISSEIYDFENNSWVKGGDMIDPRFFHRATLLDNGNVLVTGGLTTSFSILWRAEIYKLTSNSWSEAAQMNSPRFFHTATRLNNGKVLVTGGQINSSTFLKSAEIYDPLTNTWQPTGSMNESRFGHTATLLTDGRVLVTGGTDINITSKGAEIYNPSTGAWSKADDMDTKRAFHQAVLMPSGEVMVLGGSSMNNIDETIATNLVELYSPSSNEWKLMPAMNNVRTFHMAVLLKNGDILVVGGLDSDSEWLKSAEILREKSAPAPFLDLPWNYEGQGKKFEDVGLEINAYFDHSYPLLGGGMIEPANFSNQITAFDGLSDAERDYSRHDGYDWGAYKAGVKNGDPVYPAAPGIAQYVYDRAGGHGIFIDHGNGYQTRYYHLQSTGLIAKTPGVNIPVDRETVIGRVGSTGEHTTGPHIHFGVFQDKNNDGSFNDNIPDGATDPFGWQSADPDPWENYSFFQHGVQKTGNRSYYLWKKKIPKLDKKLTANGGIFEIGRYELFLPEEETLEGLEFSANLFPSEKISEIVVPIGQIINIFLRNPFGELITTLVKPIKITIDFSQADISRFKPGTVSIYSSTDRKTWKKENTLIDFFNKNATTEVDHLTYFALMGERIDTSPPTTSVNLKGVEGKDNWFRFDVEFSLDSIDNQGGLGVEIVLYKIEGEEWQEYTDPIKFSEENSYKIDYYSQDKDGNLEEPKSVEFHIDKTTPEVKVQFNRDKQEIEFIGIDDSGKVDIEEKDFGKKREQIIISDIAGNELVVEDREREKGKRSKLNIYSLSYNDQSFELDKNKFVVAYKEDENGEIKQFDQKLQLNNQDKIVLKYDPKENITKVVEDKKKQEYEGIKILQIITEKGQINYLF